MESGAGSIVNVLIVDDHRGFSNALSSMLEPALGIHVLAQVHDSRDASKKIKECDPHVVLLDYHMPHLNGIELTKRLLHDRPDLKIMIISMDNEERLIKSFQSIGAKGYLFKMASANEVIRATRKIFAGEYYFPEGASDTQDTNDHCLKKLKLSDRELEFIQLIKTGLTTRRIAEKLNISPYTAETHRKNIKLKAGITTEADFIKFINKL